MKSKMLSIVLVVLGLCFAPVAAWAQDSNNTIDISVTRTGDVTFTNWSYIHGSSLYNVTGNVNVIGSATLPNSASFELIADPGVTVTWQAELTGATGNGVGLMELGLNGAGFANFVLDTGGRITQNGSGGAPIPGVAISATPFNVTVNGGEINCTDAADAIYAGTVVINDGAVTANEGVAINSNSVTVTGGTVSSAKSYAIDGSGGSGGDVIVSGGTVKTDSDMAIYAPGGRVTVSGGTVESTSITSFNGTIVAPNMGPSPGTVTISGAGAVISASGVAIDSDDVTVTGGSVSVGRGGTAIGVGAGKALISGGEIRATGADGTGIRGGANSRIEITGGEVRAGERGVVGASVRGDAIFSEGILVTVTGGAIIAEGFDSKAIGSPVPTAAPFDAHSDIVIRVTGGTVSCIAGETPAGLAECMAFSTNGVAAFLTGTAREGSYHSGDYFGMIVEVGRLNVPLLFAGTTNELTPWTFSGTPSFSWENPLTQGNPALIETSRTSGVTTLIRSIDWGTVVGDAPVITSANSTTVRYATPSTFQVTATGVPTMAYNLSGASIPSGVTIDGASGVITIAETVGIGMYTFDITATNGSGSDSQAFTLNVETEVILSAAIGVTAPVRGATMNTAVVTCGANFSCGTVNWNPPHNPFEGGRQYTASVTLTANTGYTFTGGLTGATTINGNNATVTNNTGNTVTLSYQFPATAATPIANAAITVTAPAAGATPSGGVTCGGNFTCSAATWAPGDNPFLGGTQYTASVTLTANTGYTFTGLAGATINGQNATVTNNTGNTVTLSYQFPATAATPIANAAITVTAPAAGATPSGGVTCGINFTCSAATWAPGDNPFQGGTPYTASVTLTANTGYTFTGLTGATINTFAATVTNNTGNTVTLSYQFPAKTLTGIVIEQQPITRNYTAGQPINLAGLTVRRTYDDGTSDQVLLADFGANNITTNPADGAGAPANGRVTITATQGGITVSVLLALNVTPLAGTTAIPVLNPVGLALLALMLGGLAARRHRRV